MLDEKQKKILLDLAREAISSYLSKGVIVSAEIEDSDLNRHNGVFVSLHEKNGCLRGCIGSLIGEKPLYEGVIKAAISAAFGDSRFTPLSGNEMDSIHIEISVLSPLEKIEDPRKIITGKHGVMVRMGSRAGVYLPQVAVETGWSRDELMSSLCAHKAGIPADSWRTAKAEIFVFTAEVFGEKSNTNCH